MKKYLYLIAGIIALINFGIYFTESEPKDLFGFMLNIWIHRILWLLIGIAFLGNFSRLLKLEKNEEK